MTLRWAVIGTGFISDTVAEAIALSPGSEMIAAAGRSKKAVGDFAHRHQVAESYVGFDEVFENPRVNAVYIGTPNHVHCAQASRALLAGKAVLSEKSLTCDMGQALTLAATVRTTGQFFVEGLMYLAHPLYQRVQSLLAEAVLGELRSVNGFYCADIAHLVNSAGRGTLYNLACYPVSLLQFVIQRMCGNRSFSAYELVGFGNENSEGNICDAAVTARFDNGVLATLQSSDTQGAAHGFQIVGSKGALEFLTNPWPTDAEPCRLRLHRYGSASETIVVEDDNNAFYHQIQMVEQQVRRGASGATRPSPTIDDSLEIMAFLTHWENSIKNASP